MTDNRGAAGLSELERLRGIVDEHSEFVKRWLPDGTLTFVNSAYCRYFGGTPDGFVGSNFFATLDPGDREALEAEIRALTPDSPGASITAEITGPDGGRRWLEWTDRGLFDASGRLVEIQSSGRDVTAREEAIAALRRSEEMYRTLFEQALDAILVATLDGRIVDLNPAGVELLGFSSRQAAAGADFKDLIRDPVQCQRMFESLGAGRGLQGQETSLVTRDFREVHALLTASILRGSEQEPTMVRVIVHDVTQRRQLARQIEHAQRLESIGKLAGGIAHDFNNLLTAIGGNAELLAADLEQGGPHRLAVDSIREAAEKAVTLTQQLLAFARRQRLMPEALDLNRVVEETTTMLRRIVGEDIEILTRLAPDLGTVEADPQQVKHVLVSLALNAREAMPRGGRLDLETANVDQVLDGDEILAVGPFARLTVSDTGAGIPAELLGRVFEPFFTTKELSLGTGLGLATVYGIVRQSGGFITVRSEVGRGTAFDVFLPRVATRPRVSDGDPGQRSRQPPTATILLVEDEPAVRSFLRQVLERHGFRVLDARAAAEALELYRVEADDITLVLSDVVMPRMNGFRMVDEMVKSAPPRVLFISGYNEEALVRQGAPATPYPLLKKPFSPATLITKVREVIDGYAVH